MKQALNVFAVLIVLLGGGYLVTSHVFGPDELGDHVAEEFDRLAAEGIKENPDVPASVAIHKRAVAVVDEQLATAKSDSERNMIAAGQFWGYFYTNTRARQRYCDDVRVDITPFVDAFTQAHEREQAIGEHVMNTAGFRLEDHWDALEPTMLKAVRQEMSDLQQMYKINAVQACRIFSEHSDEMVKSMLYKDKLPASWAVLKKLADTP